MKRFADAFATLWLGLCLWFAIKVAITTSAILFADWRPKDGRPVWDTLIVDVFAGIVSCCGYYYFRKRAR